VRKPSRLALIAAAAVVVAAACTRAPQPVAAPGAPAPAWYVLDAGRFAPLAGGPLPSAPAPAMLPWTAQERVAGFARLGAAVYAAVNGQGVAAVTVDGDGARFDYLYDKAVFRGRTFKTLIAEGGALLCHVYKDALFDVPGGDAAAPNLVRMRPGAQGFEMDFVRTSLQAAEPGWQPVSVVRVRADQAAVLYLIEWKRAAADTVEFAYTSLDLSTGREARITREEFRAAYRAEALDGFAPRPGSAADLLVSRIAAETPAGQYLHVEVEGSGGPRHFVRLPAGGGESALTVTVVEVGGDALALVPDGALLRARGGVVSSARMPALPQGYVYTGFAALGDTIVASWEQADFFKVGRAGLVVARAAL
jgi:hypothetical protein